MNKEDSYVQTAKTNSLIRHIVEHTQHEFGIQYFRALVRHLAEALQVQGAWITEYIVKEQKLRSMAFWHIDHYVEHYEYGLLNTPCENVIHSGDCFLVPEKVVELFPDDPDLKPLNAVSYFGYPLFNENKEVIGHLAILHNAPLHPDEEQEAIFNLFVQRANAEFLRVKAEEQLMERKVRLSSLINSVHDAIIEMDSFGFVTLINPAASRLFDLSHEELTGTLVFGLFDDESSMFLRQSLKDIRENIKRKEFVIRQTLHCLGLNGEVIPVEASICWYEVKHVLYLTLLLRDIKELKRAEQRIEIMENKLIPHGNNKPFGIIAESKAIKKVLDDLAQVASSNSTILLLGESGTGKEVFARYIHELSLRKEKPLIKVNCAAIPTNLIESEFFGHEKGAFTGAVSRREGRFSLANGGTLFLDEIGELPIEMQPKLLRVLQEGEFEAVGGQRTLKVNVRIIAATNRNLLDMINAGTFREDLYYRLNVIPITLPSLRERGNDIIMLAEMFIKKISRETGKKILPLSNSSVNLLMQYSWPGNVRELEHVIERAVILSREGHLNLERFIAIKIPDMQIPHHNNDQNDHSILTQKELDNLERQNILKALHQCSWKISGEGGAAKLLGIPPTTLNSKIKVLKIQKSFT